MPQRSSAVCGLHRPCRFADLVRGLHNHCPRIPPPSESSFLLRGHQVYTKGALPLGLQRVKKPGQSAWVGSRTGFSTLSLSNRVAVASGSSLNDAEDRAAE